MYGTHLPKNQPVGTLGVATLDGSADSRYSDNVILTFDKADGNLSACSIMTD